ncbi:hypothetical protein KSF_105230 [Reticulibacter mediterranei]|uniref:Pentapeptide repeat-containing protein n=2 Tax=Reticulibacter mediterranei TaxID=2778369 RepID=A0A8J3IXW0_9CHLR|nr:hypothetical protein KSF_105230 [Reticulibacter mediterranei]
MKDREDERIKRAEERFQVAVTGLADKNEGVRIGAAILLRTFLHEGNQQFYFQIFDLAVVNLRLQRTAQTLKDPVPEEHPEDDLFFDEEPEDDFACYPDPPARLTTLSQALIVVFKEAFPCAREVLKERRGAFRPQFLDASYIQFDNAYLAEADLQDAWMPQVFLRKANLSHATLRGINLSRASLEEATLGDADLSHATLRGTQLYRAKLCNAKLCHADLSEAILNNADLSHANLHGTQLSHAALNLATLSGANLTKALLTGANLNKAELSNAKLNKADLSESYFSSANLSYADLSKIEVLAHTERYLMEGSKTHFNEANLSGANLSGAILRHIDFSEANLTDANLSDTTFTHTNLEEAQSLENTNLHGAKGLTKEQLAVCKAKGAIVDEDLTSDPSQLIEASTMPLQGNNIQDTSTLSDAKQQEPPADATTHQAVSESANPPP